MKTTRLTSYLGALLFSLGVGCGTADSAANGSAANTSADVLAVAGSNMNGEQLALPDGDGPCAKDHAGPIPRSELDQLTALLNLTADQVTQIQPILDATRTALDDIRAQVKAGTLTPADAQAKVKALHDSEKAQILALLTPDQQTKFNQMRDHHFGPFDITRLTDVLGLSADQVTQINTLMTGAQSQISDVNAQVEAGTLSIADAHTQIDQILKDTQTAIQTVLTADQQAKLAEILSHPGPGGGPPKGHK